MAAFWISAGVVLVPVALFLFAAWLDSLDHDDSTGGE